LVVINGQETDPNLEEELLANPQIRVERLGEASLPAALRAGWAAVDTPWFSELDDDDVLLPGALATRLRALGNHPEHDVVVTNGYRRMADQDVLHVESMEDVRADPLRALVRKNWLLPGAWLGRTEALEVGVFEGMPKYLECTYLAIRFVTEFRTLFLEEPTVVWHTDTPASASKSPEYLLSAPSSLHRILELELPPDIHAVFGERLAPALHEVAEWYRSSGQGWAAWKFHLASLASPGGRRYLPYSLKLLVGSWRVSSPGADPEDPNR
jgi:hypothetical protein